MFKKIITFFFGSKKKVASEEWIECETLSDGAVCYVRAGSCLEYEKDGRTIAFLEEKQLLPSGEVILYQKEYVIQPFSANQKGIFQVPIYKSCRVTEIKQYGLANTLVDDSKPSLDELWEENQDIDQIPNDLLIWSIERISQLRAELG